MDTPSLIKSLGVSLPSPAYLTGAIAFGLVGMAAYAHGKRVERRQTQWIAGPARSSSSGAIKMRIGFKLSSHLPHGQRQVYAVLAHLNRG